MSELPIPVHFSFSEGIHVEGNLEPDHLRHLPDVFDLPDLATMDDRIVNGTHQEQPGEPHPLNLFNAPRIDYSLHQLKHYTATSPDRFQYYVLFISYAFYVDEFIWMGRELMQITTDPEQLAYRQHYTAFVEPGDLMTWNANTIMWLFYVRMAGSCWGIVRV